VSRPVFKTCQDFLDGRDRLLKNLGRDFLNRDFLVEIKMCRDFYRDRRDYRDKSRLSRFIEISRHFGEIFTNR
jgi:hypothetical protein